MLTNNNNAEDMDTVEDEEEKDLDAESEGADSTIQARAAHIFTLLNT